MPLLTRIWQENPVLIKELRVRMRGARAYWILTGWLGFLSFILFFQYTDWWNTARSSGGFSAGSRIGQNLFIGIAIVQALLVAFIPPAITSGAITIEREQRTMEMLEMTRLSRGNIVTGKLLSAIGFLALLLVSSLPLTSICFILGGVSPQQVLNIYVLLLGGSFVMGALGLAWSSVARTTAAAVVYTYASVLVPFLALWIGAIGVAFGTTRGNPEQLTLYILTGLLGIPMGEMSWSPLNPFVKYWEMRRFYGLALPTWFGPLLLYCLIGLTLTNLAAARLETYPERRAPRLRLLTALMLLPFLFYLFGARLCVYAQAAPASLGAMMNQYPLLSLLAPPLLVLLFLIPIFATGEVNPRAGQHLSLWEGWTRAGWRRGALTSGLPYLLLLAALILLTFIGSLLLMPRALAANPGVIGSQLLQTALVMFAAVAGLSSLGVFCSALTRNRWASMALTYAALLFILITPTLSEAFYDRTVTGSRPSILINLYYLNPLMSLAEQTDITGAFWKHLPLLFGQTPLWIVSSVTYLLLAGVLFAAARWLCRLQEALA